MKKLFLTMLLVIFGISAIMADSSVVVDCGGSAQISATAADGYHFVEWKEDHNTDNPRIVSPSANVTYTAVFALNQYTITFKNWNGDVLQTNTYDHGDPVSYTGATPTKTDPTGQYEYTFSGWSPNVSSVATEDVIYIAQFDQSTRKYTVTFQNWDGEVLQFTEEYYGTMPSYNGATPTKPSDDQYNYSFSGWSPVITSVTGDVIYIAQFNNGTNSYTIIAGGANGTVTGGGTYQYNTQVNLTATPSECYVFAGWEDETSLPDDQKSGSTRTITVTGNATFTAIFTKVQYTVTVVAEDPNAGSVNVVVIP